MVVPSGEIASGVVAQPPDCALAGAIDSPRSRAQAANAASVRRRGLPPPPPCERSCYHDAPQLSGLARRRTVAATAGDARQPTRPASSPLCEWVILGGFRALCAPAWGLFTLPSFLRIRHSCASVIPAHPSFLRRQEPTPTPNHSPIHPSPLPGGRLGGGWEIASQRRPPSCTPIAFPVVPAPPPVIPACAGMTDV